MRNAPTTWKAFMARNNDLALAVGLVLIATYFFSGAFTTVRFDRERIELRVKRGLILVGGLYHYTNASRLPALLTLAVPMPIDAAHPAPEALFLCEATEDGRALSEVHLNRRGDEARFRLIFWPGEAKWIRLDYA